MQAEGATLPQRRKIYENFQQPYGHET